jgi:hypothetical protein
MQRHLEMPYVWVYNYCNLIEIWQLKGKKSITGLSIHDIKSQGGVIWRISGKAWEKSKVGSKLGLFEITGADPDEGYAYH